jgi:hypothetical protein
MNKFTRYRSISTAVMSFLLIAMTNSISGQTRTKIDLMYDNVWGSLYNPEPEQCDETPTITADGSHIDTLNASKQRWVAVSQDLLWSPRRHRLFVKDTINDHRYQGRIKFGDTIWIESPNPRINGKWVVHDLMNKKYHNAIDFLQTTGDGYLYNNDKLWDGKFKIISVYRITKEVENNIQKVKVPSNKILTNYVERIKEERLIPNKFLTPTLDDMWNCLHLNHMKAQEKSFDLRIMLYKEQTEIDSIKREIRKSDALEKTYRKKIRKLNKNSIIY